MHAYHCEKMKEEKRKNLEIRRERLRELMLEEQDLLAAELDELKLSMSLREQRLREQHQDLKSAREEQRKLVTTLDQAGCGVGTSQPELTVYLWSVGVVHGCLVR